MLKLNRKKAGVVEASIAEYLTIRYRSEIKGLDYQGSGDTQSLGQVSFIRQYVEQYLDKNSETMSYPLEFSEALYCQDILKSIDELINNNSKECDVELNKIMDNFLLILRSDYEQINDVVQGINMDEQNKIVDNNMISLLDYFIEKYYSAEDYNTVIQTISHEHLREYFVQDITEELKESIGRIEDTQAVFSIAMGIIV